MNVWERLQAVQRFWHARLHADRVAIGRLLGGELRGATVLDVDAGLGVYTFWLSRAVGPRGRVIATAASSPRAAHLDAVREAFELDNVTVERVELTDRRRPVDRSDRSAASGNPELSLDDLLEAYGRPAVDAVRCAADARTAGLLRGGLETLTRDGPLLVFSGRDGLDITSRALLRDCGYRVEAAGLGGSRLFFSERHSDENRGRAAA